MTTISFRRWLSSSQVNQWMVERLPPGWTSMACNLPILSQTSDRAKVSQAPVAKPHSSQRKNAKSKSKMISILKSRGFFQELALLEIRATFTFEVTLLEHDFFCFDLIRYSYFDQHFSPFHN